MTISDLHALTGRLIKKGHGEHEVVDDSCGSLYANELCDLEPVTLQAVFNEETSRYEPKKTEAYRLILCEESGYATVEDANP